MRAFVIVSSVVNVFDAMMNSVVSGSRSRVASRKSAPSTFDTKRYVIARSANGGERGGGHARAEVAAADPDVDDGLDAPAGVAGPGAAAHAVGERAHAVEDRVDLGHHVHAVDLDHRVARRPQRDVQHGAILGDVDLLAAEHRVARRASTPARRATAASSVIVSAVTRCFE